MTTHTLALPLLTGTWKDAHRLVGAAGLPTDLSATELHIDASGTVAGTLSFAGELVRILLLQRRADRMIVDHAGAGLAHQLFDAARHWSVADRLVVHEGQFRPPTRGSAHPHSPTNSPDGLAR